jgi:hypothetical protein
MGKPNKSLWKETDDKRLSHESRKWVRAAAELRPDAISRIIQPKHYIICSWRCLGRKVHEQKRLPHSARPCIRGVNQHDVHKNLDRNTTMKITNKMHYID